MQNSEAEIGRNLAGQQMPLDLAEFVTSDRWMGIFQCWMKLKR